MTLVLTMMVRDEADIIAATIEHHLAQGVDHIVVTENGSVDGTLEILRAYAEVAPLTLLQDAEHRKQQGEVVTRMARLAHDELGADWVINGDADEFVRAMDPSRTVGEVLAAMPTSIGAFPAPVVNLVGPMAERGSGIRRLVHRDERSEDALRAAGLIAHPTPNAIHVGRSDVTVAQGNHFTSIEQVGEVPVGLELEVLHLPWRSIAQLRRKTENMGRGYEASPDLRPSPRHHGMRDWRRMQGGVLDAFLALRTPTAAELAAGGFREDRSLREQLEALEASALLPSRLRACLDDRDDAVLPDERVEELRAIAVTITKAEEPLYEELTGLRMHSDALDELRWRLVEERDDARQRLASAEAARSAAQAEREALGLELARAQEAYGAVRARLDAIEGHPVIRAVRSVRGGLRRGR
ncbi:MAG: glycosyltransferase family 2 protein [Agrococcus sp.]